MIRKVVCWFFAVIFGITTLGGVLSITDPNAPTTGSDMVPFTIIFAAITALFVWLAVKKPKPFKKQRATLEAQQAEEKRKARIAEVEAVTELPVIAAPVSVVLRPGEVCHYQTPASIVEIKERVVGYSGGSGGVSVRVAKGVTLHSGRSRGAPIRADVAKEYPGFFTITDQRMIMTGEKGFDHPLTKLTSMTPWNGFQGIILQFGRSSYIVEMDESYWIPKIIDLLNEQRLAQ